MEALSLKQNGGAFMLSLCMTGLFGFLEFLKSAVFVVRIYSRWDIVPRAIDIRRGEKLFRANG